jgi:predicted amidohydrolase
MRAAAIQLNSTDDRHRNMAVAERLVREAADDGAELIVLPEKWTVLGSHDAIKEGAEELSGPALRAAQGWAQELEVHLVAGSIAEQMPGHKKLANTSAIIGPDGGFRAVYRKIHMFDVDVEDHSYRESEIEQPGEEIVVAEAGEIDVGLSICYDLRFPELYRILAIEGADVITVPSAFTERTGRDHWEVLVRARAIENQVFVIAPNQIGDAPPDYKSYGHSMIVDPWGVILAQAPDVECFVTADLDFAVQIEMRESFPALANRRPEAYAWPDREDGKGGAASIAEPTLPAGAP